MAYIDKITTNGVTYDVQDSHAQRTLVSGTNIKTINGNSILGSGNISISGSGGSQRGVSVIEVSFPGGGYSDVYYTISSGNAAFSSSGKYIMTYQGGNGSDAITPCVWVFDGQNQPKDSAGFIEGCPYVPHLFSHSSDRTVFSFASQSHSSTSMPGSDWGITTIIPYDTIIFSQVSCFTGDTEVAMADGSTKLISEVKPQDQLAYYSNKKKALSTATVYCVEEGWANTYVEYEFENGHKVKVVGRQRFYHVGKNQMVDISEFAIGDKTRLLDGTDVALVGSEKVVCDEPFKHYHIVTDTAAYHANGFMVGMLRRNIYRYIDKYNLQDQIPAEKLRWHKAFYEHNKALDFKHSDAYIQELSNIKLKKSRIDYELNTIKMELNSLDYKTTKYIEGALGEEEWVANCQHKAELRELYNQKELELAPIEAEITAIDEKYAAIVKKYKVEDFLDK